MCRYRYSLAPVLLILVLMALPAYAQVDAIRIGWTSAEVEAALGREYLAIDSFVILATPLPGPVMFDDSEDMDSSSVAPEPTPTLDSLYASYPYIIYIGPISVAGLPGLLRVEYVRDRVTELQWIRGDTSGLPDIMMRSWRPAFRWRKGRGENEWRRIRDRLASITPGITETRPALPILHSWSGILPDDGGTMSFEHTAYGLVYTLVSDVP